MPSLASSQGIRGSKHDFSSTNTSAKWGSQDTAQICIFCHAPHSALTQTALWNHNPGSSGASFSRYGNVAGQSSSYKGVNDAAVNNTSLRCLSCHDGSVAIDSINAGRSSWTHNMKAIGDIYYPGSPYFTGAGVNIGGNYAGNANVNNLSDDHPISFAYNAALVAADGALNDPALAPPGSDLASLPLFGATNDRLECSTCHEVHGKFLPNKWFLRVDVEQSSRLCKACHIK